MCRVFPTFSPIDQLQILFCGSIWTQFEKHWSRVIEIGLKIIEECKKSIKDQFSASKISGCNEKKSRVATSDSKL